MLGWQLLSDSSSLLEASLMWHVFGGLLTAKPRSFHYVAAFRKRAFHDASGMDLGAG
jgi:hypothetical protein